MIAEVQKQIQCSSVSEYTSNFSEVYKIYFPQQRKISHIQMVTIIFCSSSKYSPLWPLHSQRIIFSFSLIFRKLKERDIPTVAQMVKNLPAMQETWVQSLGWEDPWRREWLFIPVLLPGEVHGLRSLAGYRLYIIHGVAKSQTQLSN